jgi:hypothetical protein
VVREWLPRPSRQPRPGAPAAEIRVRAGAAPPAPAGTPAALELYGVRGWTTAGGEMVLADGAGRIGARVEMEACRATVWVNTDHGPPDTHDVFATFTIVAGLLLTRLGRALVHAGAVVAPGGGAWLLPGGSFSGKSTTCITLIRAGWNFLGDDHVVLAAGAAGEVRAEGWLRPFHLDRGYHSGVSQGVRSRVEPLGFGPGEWQPAAPVAGILFPRVEAESPTALVPLHPALALARLVSVSPFMGLDPPAAPPVLALLQTVASHPVYELRLGQDSYCNPHRLQFAVFAACDTPAAPKRL